MKSAILYGLAIGLVASSASAMPLIHPPMVPDSNLLNVKIVCEPNGYCAHRGRRPVVRWIYGDNVFYGPGPYVGPGYYGAPGHHYSWWWPFFGF